ncbi:MAG: M20/M25/M40 family metallo-hydrolase [Gemmatimonadaceae bacterium]|nr:M20/M25/M40 family metallo-hydrolase [Gemmatimonadaceae bacterium]
MTRPVPARRRSVAALRRLWRAVAIVALGSVAAAAQAPTPREDSLHRAIFRELVEINTSPLGGNVSRASRAVQRRLLGAGYSARDARVVGGAPSCLNVVATLRGRDATARPLLLMAHLDVVGARRADWTHDPYVLREADGWFYGRGVMDNKAGASVLVANMIRWKRERFVPQRDVIMVLTCDEETTAAGGIGWLLEHEPRLRAADYALNTDAGGASDSQSGRVAFDLPAAEKMYATFEFVARNPGGHSSVPRPDNAVYALAAALTRLANHRFPILYNDVTRGAFTRGADLETGQLAEDMRAAGRGETTGAAIDRLLQNPVLANQLHTTCVATMLSGGHAENALAQSATATVNCRVMPGVPIAEVERTLADLVADTSVTVRLTAPPTPSPASPLRADVLPTIEAMAERFWPGAVVVPGMSAGATDGLYLRNAGVPVYGAGAILMDPARDRSHGLDETVPVQALYRAREYWYELVKALTSGQARTM